MFFQFTGGSKVFKIVGQFSVKKFKFTLNYIYKVLLKKDFDDEILHTLNMLQYYRDQIKSGEYFDI